MNPTYDDPIRIWLFGAICGTNFIGYLWRDLLVAIRGTIYYWLSVSRFISGYHGMFLAPLIDFFWHDLILAICGTGCTLVIGNLWAHKDEILIKRLFSSDVIEWLMVHGLWLKAPGGGAGPPCPEP